MSVGQQLVQQQQMQLKQQSGQTDFLTQILTTSTGIQDQGLSRTRLLTVAANNKQQVSLSTKPNVTISSGLVASPSQLAVTNQQSIPQPLQHNSTGGSFINTVSNQPIALQHQQSLLAAQTVSSQALSPSVSSTIDDSDTALSQILDEVIEMQSTQANSTNSSVQPSSGIGQSSLSSLLSNAPSANRKPLDDLSLAGISNEPSHTDLNNEQQAISEIYKNLVSCEQEKSKGQQAMFNSQPPTPQSPMMPTLQQNPMTNYQNSVPPPPSYPSATFNQMNSQVTKQLLNFHCKFFM